MKIVIDISKDRYDEIMSMDWNNCRRFFDEELRAIHDGKALQQEPFINKPCVSEKVCEHDKQIVLDKIRAEIEQHCNITVGSDNEPAMTLHDIFAIIEKHVSGKEQE